MLEVDNPAREWEKAEKNQDNRIPNENRIGKSICGYKKAKNGVKNKKQRNEGKEIFAEGKNFNFSCNDISMIATMILI